METIRLSVYRCFDDRAQGEPDDAASARELHERRLHALEDALDKGDEEIHVLDWGETKDSEPHELVELVVGVGGPAALKYVVVPALTMLGEKLVELGTDRAASELVKAVVSRLWPKQQAKQLNDYWITLPNGTRVAVEPPDRQTTITVTGSGSSVTIDYGGDGQ